ncbi:uncharacterized protein RCO7_03586 [Rhynchosporium graminicola]|uniref:Glycosyl hydrolase family 92 domain-containing protein n=1 Tax=Rhynchosporium graminicola TaxID=2792576 RepID=A0A1E1KUK9_9HELO|nr:uncharacterized protein RCO7_03586 [Rhynchosporium commune]
MISLMGGPETVVRRLVTMFKNGANPKQPNATILEVTDELPFKVPYLLNYVGRQDRSVFQARGIAYRQITLLIHPSWYGSMTIDLGTGKRLKVTSIGGDGNGDIKSLRSKP